MASVEAAARSFARRFSLLDPEYLVLFDIAELGLKDRSSDREHLRVLSDSGVHLETARDDLFERTAGRELIYWGDWLHMSHYLSDVAQRLVSVGASPDPRSAQQRASDLLLPDRHQPGQRLSFGSTLLLDTPHAVRAGATSDRAAYHTRLRSFLEGLSSTWFREPLSASAAAALLGDDGRIRTGLDCAFMLSNADREALPSNQNWEHPAGQCLVFFGRSRINPFALSGLLRQLNGELQKDLVWLPWGFHRRFPSVDTSRKFRALRPPVDFTTLSGVPTPGDLLRAVAAADIVITDTYHLAMNAWAAGTPAIAVCGRSAPADVFDVNVGRSPSDVTDKRAVASWQLGAEEYLLPISSLADRRSRAEAAERIAGVLDGSLGVLQHISRLRERLDAELAATFDDADTV